MKKFFLITCFALSASLAFSQGYFSQEEIKKLDLEVSYDQKTDSYFYGLKNKNTKEKNGGQNPNFYAEIYYDKNKGETALVLYFKNNEYGYEINLQEALVSIDGKTHTFLPEWDNNVNLNHHGENTLDEWFPALIYTSDIYLGGGGTNRQYLIFLMNLIKSRNPKDVKLLLKGKNPPIRQFTLTEKEIEATGKIIEIFLTIKWRIGALDLQQGYFSLEEIKKLNLEVSYDSIKDVYFYGLKNTKEKKGGQNPNFYAEIYYDNNKEESALVLYVKYNGTKLLNLQEALVSIDGETHTFLPRSEDEIHQRKFYRDSEDFADEWFAVFMYTQAIYDGRKKDRQDVSFLNRIIVLETKNVTIHLTGKKGTHQFSLTEKEIQAIGNVIDIYFNKGWYQG